MQLKLNDPVTYQGRPAQVITLPIPNGRHPPRVIIRTSDGRGLSVRADQVTKKETGPAKDPVSH